MLTWIDKGSSRNIFYIYIYIYIYIHIYIYIYDQSVDSSRFALWELISTAQIKWRSWRTIQFLVKRHEEWVFHCYEIEFFWLIFVFSMFNHSFKKSYAKCVKLTDLQTDFSEKNIWWSSQVFRETDVPKFGGKRSVLSIAIRCGYLTAICYLFLPFLYYKKIWFSGKILTEIQNNYYEL